MNFRDKTVIITGGSAGVGAATARRFADAGASLLLVARNRRGLESMAAELRDKVRVEIFPMDVTDAEACGNLFKKAEFDFGRIDILVNNAGHHERGRFESVAARDHARMIDVNLRAPVMLSRMCLPYLRAVGGGAIVNVGSLAGRAPFPGQVTYSAAKAGLRAFTLALAEELRGTGIKIALVSPGPIDTDFIMSNPDVVADLTFSQPISTADAVAQLVMELCANRRREMAIPVVSGVLASLNALLPPLGRLVRPLLERKGARVRKKLLEEKAARQGE